MITNLDIAEIYAALGDPRAPLTASLAAEEDRAERVRLEESDQSVDALWTLLQSVEDQDRLKHGDDCWKQHAGCLAEKIRDAMGWQE